MARRVTDLATGSDPVLEIILLIKLCSSISAKAKRKGRRGWPYGLLFFFVWITAEVVGGIVGVMLFNDKLAAYLFAIGGVIVASVCTFAIVGALPPKRAASTRWQRAELVFDIDESDTAGEIRRGDLVCAPVAIRPGDLLRLERDDDGRIQLQTVFEDELGDRPGLTFRAEQSPSGGLPRLVPAPSAKRTMHASGNGDQSRSTRFTGEPPVN
jgi:hypothetical protein